MQQLEAQFHEAMLRIYEEAAKLGYRPTYFMKMVQSSGGVEAARSLLGTKAPADGFTRLWELDRLDLSVEAVALKSEYHELFSAEQLASAAQRLSEYGYTKEDQ